MHRIFYNIELELQEHLKASLGVPTVPTFALAILICAAGKPLPILLKNDPAI